MSRMRARTLQGRGHAYALSRYLMDGTPAGPDDPRTKLAEQARKAEEKLPPARSRTCAVEGCPTLLNRYNEHRVCRRHFELGVAPPAEG